MVSYDESKETFNKAFDGKGEEEKGQRVLDSISMARVMREEGKLRNELWWHVSELPLHLKAGELPSLVVFAC